VLILMLSLTSAGDWLGN